MNKQLSKKIDELFIYRKFPELLEQVGEQYTRHPLIKKLKRLQETIYYLDHHLETNWDVKPKDLKPYWKDIYAALSDLEIKKKDHDDYCKLIYKYQKHELYLRENKLPTRFNMEFYYYFKSCDVKLLRRIIYDHFPQLKSRYTLADWRCFDLITEVNDDVEDVFEDQTTINGNYFLIAYLTGNKSKALKSFNEFISYISDKDKTRKLKADDNYLWVSKLTQVEIKSTRSLLKANYTTLNKSLTQPTRLEEYLTD